MLSTVELKRYRNVQSIAKAVLAQLPAFITPHETEQSLCDIAKKLLAKHCALNTWYHGVHALVLLGSRSCLSISGRLYHPSDEAVGEKNLVSVDLSPEIDGVWGDYARSYAVENGQVVAVPSDFALRSGMDKALQLHEAMRKFISPSRTFHELYEFGNDNIRQHGYENLDFRHNLGHSIAREMKDRLFIEQGNKTPLSAVDLFTFEPHIRAVGGSWGFKHENIYYFDERGIIHEL